MVVDKGEPRPYLIAFRIRSMAYGYWVHGVGDFRSGADGRHIQLDGSTPAKETPDIWRPWRGTYSKDSGYDPLAGGNQ